LAAFRDVNRVHYPAFHNAPVPAVGDLSARVLIVGLAPGLKGANATGRPFTADYAGDLLYPTLLETGFAEGHYLRRRDDGLKLIDCRITNAVRCVPPLNRPEGTEISTCRTTFLTPEIAAMPNLRLILALGTVSHNSILAAFGQRLSAFKFRHGARHDLGCGLTLFDSYHCSRYNTSTGVLTVAMFMAVVRDVAHARNGLATIK
jgi:uracil-DNA glycosylase family 4